MQKQTDTTEPIKAFAIIFFIAMRILRVGKDGIIVVETEKGGEIAAHSDYKTIREATYGKTVITVLIRGDEK